VPNDLGASHGRDETAELLLTLAARLHAVGTPADVVGDRIRRAAAGLGAQVQVFSSAGCVILEVTDEGGRRVHVGPLGLSTSWDLARLHELEEVSHAVAVRGMSAVQASRDLATIAAQPPPYSTAAVFVCYATYAAAVAARIGGAWREMMVAALVGLAAGLIHVGTRGRAHIDLQRTFLAALVGTLTAFVLTTVLPPFEVAKAAFAGIALLVPALVVTIGVHELANETLESGVVRLANGVLKFVMLGAGAAAAVALASLVLPVTAPTSATPLPRWAVIGILAVGGLALVVCLRGRVRDAPWIVAGVLCAYGAQEMTKLFAGDRGSPFLASLVLGAAAHLQARLPRHIPATMIVPGLFQLAPGSLGTQATLRLLQGSAEARGGFVDVVLVALQLGTGLLVAGALFRRSPPTGALGVRPGG
jgi:uncharacterized membrane protein YjjP (DUF1212 family)